MTSGNFLNTGEKMRSAGGLHDVHRLERDHHVDRRVGRGDRRASPDEPMCMHTTVPSSEHAFQNGSQWSECRLGSPSGTGFSGNVIAWQPFFATRRTSSAIASGSQIGGIASGMKRLGRVAAPLVDVPVVVGLRAGRERGVLVVERREQAAREAGQRREVQRAEQPVGRHVEHALLDVVRSPCAELVEATSGRCRTPPAGGPRPRSARRWGSRSRGTSTTSVPSSWCTTCGAMSWYFAGRWRSNTSGGSTTWSSTLTMIMSSICIGRAPGSCPGSPARSGASSGSRRSPSRLPPAGGDRPDLALGARGPTDCGIRTTK